MGSVCALGDYGTTSTHLNFFFLCLSLSVSLCLSLSLSLSLCVSLSLLFRIHIRPLTPSFSRPLCIAVNHNASVIIGGYSLPSLSSLYAPVEYYDNLLLFPSPTAGLECEPNVFHGGPTPHQQLEPFLFFAMKNLGNDFAIIHEQGSSFSEPMAELTRSILRQVGANLRGQINVTNGDVSAVPQMLGKMLPSGGIVLVSPPVLLGKFT